MKLLLTNYRLLIAASLLFTCYSNSGAAQDSNSVEVYKDWMFGPFNKSGKDINPVLGPNFDSRFFCPIQKKTVRWETRAIIGGAATVKNGKVYMVYQGEDDTNGYTLHTHGSPGTMRMGLAVSKDGMLFDRMTAPILFPKEDNYKSLEWPGGCEIPRIVQSPDGTYVFFYNGWDKSRARLMVATSKDLRKWTKHGSPFAKIHGSKYANGWSKSAAVITELKDGKLVAAKINGKYWMYWGEEGVSIATSDNLIDWTMVENPDGSRRKLLTKRPGRFDDRTIEAGVAVLTDRGIVLIYNTFRFKKENEAGEPVLGSGLAQALVDRKDPTRVVDRSEVPFLIPDREYEIQGAVNNVVFCTGLVYFNGKWLLYHNGGDRVMCVAVADAKDNSATLKVKTQPK